MRMRTVARQLAGPLSAVPTECEASQAGRWRSRSEPTWRISTKPSLERPQVNVVRRLAAVSRGRGRRHELRQTAVITSVVQAP